MWFAKWFGGRNTVGEGDDEPARFAPVEARKPVEPAARPIPAGVKAQPRPAAKQGFDPYNSGAFERRSAWERITRR